MPKSYDRISHDLSTQLLRLMAMMDSISKASPTTDMQLSFNDALSKAKELSNELFKSESGPSLGTRRRQLK